LVSLLDGGTPPITSRMEVKMSLVDRVQANANPFASI
jgi:hypothetical protein